MHKTIAYIFLLFILFQSCSSNPLDVDVSQVDVEINFHRFDQALFDASTINELNQANQNCIKEGGQLYEFYTIEMLKVGSPYDDSIANYLNMFTHDEIMRMTYGQMQSKFNSLDKVQLEMVDAFKHLKYHIPEVMLPSDIYFYNSAFSYGMVSTPNQMGVGLEMYLGEEDTIVKQLPFPAYFKKKMNEEYLLADMAESWITNNVIEDQSGMTFLSNLLYYGKVMYLIDAMLPQMADHQKMRYTELEYEWAEVSEYNVWQYVVEQNWIYSDEIKLMVRFFKDAPTTVGLDGSPSRMGVYLGWKIIKSYMEKHPEVTIKELIAEKNESKLLKAYKPDKP